MTAARGTSTGMYGTGSTGSTRSAGLSRNSSKGAHNSRGYDSNRPPNAQRSFDGRTSAGNFNSMTNRPTSSGANLGPAAGSDANRANGGRTMTASFASTMHDGPSAGRG